MEVFLEARGQRPDKTGTVGRGLCSRRLQPLPSLRPRIRSGVTPAISGPTGYGHLPHPAIPITVTRRGELCSPAVCSNGCRHCGLDPQSQATPSLNPSGQTQWYKTAWRGGSRALALRWYGSSAGERSSPLRARGQRPDKASTVGNGLDRSAFKNPG